MKENNIKKNIKSENLQKKEKRINSVVNSILSESTSKIPMDTIQDVLKEKLLDRYKMWMIYKKRKITPRKEISYDLHNRNHKYV